MYSSRVTDCNPIFSRRSTSMSLCTISPRQYNLSAVFNSLSADFIALATPEQNPERLSISTLIFSLLFFLPFRGSTATVLHGIESCYPKQEHLQPFSKGSSRGLNRWNPALQHYS